MREIPSICPKLRIFLFGVSLKTIILYYFNWEMFVEKEEEVNRKKTCARNKLQKKHKHKKIW